MFTPMSTPLPRPSRLQQARLARSGFTLIEVLVALVILSVMAAMAWKGMDGITRSREIADGGLKRTLRMQSVMQQWSADLNSVIATGVVQGIQFDGAALRLTRQSQGGVQVVVWALRSGRWVRWAGQPVTNVGALQDQWMRSFNFQGREPGSIAALKGVEQWQVYFFRGGAWSNAQSSAGGSADSPTNPGFNTPGATAAASAAANGTAASGQARILARSVGTGEPLPMGVRCVLTLGDGSGFAGSIVKDALLAAQPGQN
jgi:general secretion pathway protein J